MAELVEAGPAVGGDGGQLAQLCAKRWPAAGGNQVAGGVGVAPGTLHPYVPRAQGVSEHVEHHQLPVATVRAVVAVFGRGQVIPPAGGHEVVRGIIGHPASAAGIEVLEDLDGFEQAGRLRPAVEGQGGEHAWGKGPQAGVASPEQLQVTGVAPGATPGRQTSLAQGVHAHPAPQQPADGLVGHAGVGQDLQQLIEEDLPALGVLCSFRQPLVELVPGP